MSACKKVSSSANTPDWWYMYTGLYLAKSVCGFMNIERIHLSVYLFGVILSICVGDGLCRRVLETGMGWEKSRRKNLQHNVIPSYAVYQVNCYASTYKHIYIHISSCIRGTVCWMSLCSGIPAPKSFHLFFLWKVKGGTWILHVSCGCWGK